MEGTTKKCSKCGEFKLLNEFYKSSKNESFGVRNICKKCTTIQTLEWRERNPGRHAEAKRNRYKKNPAKAKETAKKYRNKDKERERRERYQTENREKYLGTARKSAAKRRSTLQGRLADNISRGVRNRLIKGKGGRSTFQVLGYTVDDLKAHLESQFQPDMTWENYGEWHIDHIIPASVFNYETVDDEDFKRCWALSNLQPLWAVDNLSKKDKLDKPFQPSLLLRPANDNASHAASKKKNND